MGQGVGCARTTRNGNSDTIASQCDDGLFYHATRAGLGKHIAPRALVSIAVMCGRW